MELLTIQRILGLLLLLFSPAMLPPLAVAWWYDDGGLWAFTLAFVATALAGLALWLPVMAWRRELRLRDGFVVVVMCWVALALVGALPLMLAERPEVSFIDALFESMSGLTTTGSTVLTGLEELPRSILFYRQQLQWIGGMGIIVLAVAILPLLGIGGMQLYRAETPGPMKDTKLTPRIKETAKALWYVYLGITVACALAYWLAGMGPFDAVAHSFTTVAIGGFSPYDDSIGHFDSTAINLVAVAFMLLAGMNFALHFLALRDVSVRPYLRDAEVKAYFTILGLVTVACIAYLYALGTYATLGDTVVHGLFQAVSISTTTGYTTADFHLWPGFLPALLIIASFVGACGGSTGGGMKVIRFLLLYKQGVREVIRLVHPSAQIPVKVGSKSLTDRVVASVWGFFSVYVTSFVMLSLIVAGTGLDLVTAFSAVAACLNNLGPGLGDVGPHFADLGPVAKGTLTFAMLLGRLEVFTVLVLLTPAFWRR